MANFGALGTLRHAYRTLIKPSTSALVRRVEEPILRQNHSSFATRANVFSRRAVDHGDAQYSPSHLYPSIGQSPSRRPSIDVLSNLFDSMAKPVGAPMQESERRDFWEICEERYQTRSTILTSQVPIAQWHEQIGDATTANGILDRLVHNAHRIELRGESMRKTRVKKTESKDEPQT